MAAAVEVAVAVAVATTTVGSAPTLVGPPLFECFVNVPHPAASKSSGPPMVVIPAPHAPADGKLLKQIQAFCFPEYEDVKGQYSSAFRNMQVNRFDQYAMQPKSFTSFTFTLQQQDGRRLYGHVRRTLPLHEKAPTRYDVGRRGERALVLLTQTAGAGQLYQAILKSVDALISMQKALTQDLIRQEEAEKMFLHALYKEQQRMASHYQHRPTEDRGKPLICILSNMELHSSPLFVHQDVNRFMIPTCLLQAYHPDDAAALQNLPTADSTSSLLPLLRCVGVAHALRILAALLSERRIILTSSSPTRLSTCSHAALAMLHCGLLHWQHLYIPVLPPHLWQYLAAPYPYLIGILQSAVVKLDKTDGLGEVLIVNLDTNSMETRNIPQQVIAQRLPDLFSAADPNYYNENSPGTPSHKLYNKDMPPSPPEFLAQDLLEILKTDKKTLYGESSAMANVGEKAGQAAKAIKSGFSKLKAKLKGQTSTGSEKNSNEEEEDAADGKGNDDSPAESKSVADDYIFTEGCHNEVGEQEARLAFTVFFLALIGNMRWYLSVSNVQGELPQLDRNRFLEQKRQAGGGQGSALWPLLQNFCQTQMFEEFAKARVEEIRLRIAVSGPDAPLFAQCAEYHRRHNIDFAIPSVRRVARQVAQANPGRLTGLLQTNARRMAMTLTSNKHCEGDFDRAIAQLVEQCRESSSVLFDVMSVIWLRLRDTKGMHWKHGHHAMQLLKNLLYHGPLAVVAEATDGLEKIRALKYYEHLRGGVAQDMRNSADTLYNLLVDRSKLWTTRRLCAKKRRDMTIPVAKRPRLEKMTTIRITHDIVQIHGAFHPLARATIVQVPSLQQQNQVPAPIITTLVTGPAPTPQYDEANDFFGLGAASAAAAPGHRANPSSVVSQDLMGLFDSMDMTGQNSSELSLNDGASGSFEAKPTIVALPPQPQPGLGVPLPADRTASVGSVSSVNSFSVPMPRAHQPPALGAVQGGLNVTDAFVDMAAPAAPVASLVSATGGMTVTDAFAIPPTTPIRGRPTTPQQYHAVATPQYAVPQPPLGYGVAPQSVSVPQPQYQVQAQYYQQPAYPAQAYQYQQHYNQQQQHHYYQQHPPVVPQPPALQPVYANPFATPPPQPPPPASATKPATTQFDPFAGL